MTVPRSSRNKYVKALLCIIFLTFFIQSGNSTSRKNKDTLVVDADSNVQQRISILVGKAGEDTGTDDEPPIDDIPTDGDSNNPPSVNVNDEFCSGTRCCYQYTWTGYVEPSEIPESAENRTCEHFKKENNAPYSACFDPIIYTTRSSDPVGDVGRRPDMKALEELSKQNDWPIYCPLTRAKSCMTYTFYSRQGDKQIVNMTRFCGSVTDILKGNRITSGCFTENVAGYVKEICVCDDESLCNSVAKLIPSSIQFAILFFSFRAYF